MTLWSYQEEVLKLHIRFSRLRRNSRCRIGPEERDGAEGDLEPG